MLYKAHVGDFFVVMLGFAPSSKTSFAYSINDRFYVPSTANALVSAHFLMIQMQLKVLLSSV
eukprot:8618455-Ditylum_brightwellii.AAC.1